MKASELIKKLQELIEYYGDLEVEVPKTDNCYYGHTEILCVEIDKSENIIELLGR